MANINDNDKPGINDAFEKLMRIAGLREGVLTFQFTDLLDQGTDSNPTYGTISATALVSATAAMLPITSSVADGAVIAIKLGSSEALSNAAAKLVSVQNDDVEMVAVHATGKLVWPTGGAADVVGVSGALAAGSVSVASTAVAAGSKVFLTRAVAGGTLGHLSVGVITPGVSFTITSSDVADTSTVNWMIVN